MFLADGSSKSKAAVVLVFFGELLFVVSGR